EARTKRKKKTMMVRTERDIAPPGMLAEKKTCPTSEGLRNCARERKTSGLLTNGPERFHDGSSHYFLRGGGGYSGNLSLLVSARLTSSSSKRSDGLMTVVGMPPGRLLTRGALRAAIAAARRARVSSWLKAVPA